MASSFDRWEKDPFFSAAEEVQESADRYQFFLLSSICFYFFLLIFYTIYLSSKKIFMRNGSADVSLSIREMIDNSWFRILYSVVSPYFLNNLMKDGIRVMLLVLFGSHWFDYLCLLLKDGIYVQNMGPC